MFIRHKMVWLFIVFALVISLTGCNMPGDDAPVSPQEELNPESEPAQDELNPETEPGQDDANPPITEPTVWPTVLPNAERDACLEGKWIMPTDRLDLLVATLFPQTSSFLRVTEGSLSMSFTEENFYYEGKYVLHVDSPDGGYSEASIDLFSSGFYATEDDDRLILDMTVTESHTVTCTAYKDGQTFSVPCAGLGMTEILPPSASPYLCSENELQIEILSPAGEPITMFFER